MDTLLSNPAIQAAVAPFVVALVLTLILRRCLPGGTGLAVIAGFLVAVWLVTGLTLQPLTSTRKIIICSLTLPFVAMLLEMIPPISQSTWLKRAVQTASALILVAAALWIIWPVVQRQEGMAAWLMAMPVVLFAGAVIYGAGLLSRLQNSETAVFSTQAASALLLAMGVGATCLIAASALYSQLAFAVSAAVGAVIVVAMFSSQEHRLGMLTIYAAAVPVTLFVAAATVYASLPVLVLFCLALVPVFAGLPLPKPSQRWPQLIVTCLWASVPVLPAVWLTWRAAGPVSF
jgi:hypothetical protein